MRISKRVAGLVPGGDDGWGLYFRARELAAAGEPVVNLTIGDHDVKTDPAILTAMKASMDAGHLGYATVEGTTALREAVARRTAARSGTRTSAEEVLVTPGGQAALFACLMAAMEPGESAVILDPFYATYPQTVRAAGGRPIVVEARAEAGFQPDARAIEAALEPDTRALLINTPNNPTGAVYAREALEALARLCIARDLWLISDEVYNAQVWEGRHLSPRDLPDMRARTLVAQSMSKSHAMTGSRLGWVVGPVEAVEALGDLSTATTYGVPGFVQDAAAWALAEGEETEAAVVARYARRRAAALSALEAAPEGLRVVPPQGGMYVMLDVRPTGLSGTAFAERLLEAERIAVMPGESFGRAAAGHVRVALTRPEAELAEALGRIAGLAARLRETASA